MLFTEEEAPPLKSWIVNRLKDTSDADSDVLADYVLALLRHDGDEQDIRQLCEAEIPDFLKEDSAGFVQDVFNAIHFKLFLPKSEQIMPPTAPASTNYPQHNSYGASIPNGPRYGNLGAAGVPTGPQNGNKRTFSDRGDVEMQDRFEGAHNGHNTSDRMYKASRRGGAHPNHRGNFQQGYNGQGGASQGHDIAQSGFAQLMSQMPQMPIPPPGMPGMPAFDPNDPLAAMLAMQQAMGLAMPGTNTSQLVNNNIPASKKCREFEQKGFCHRGNACRYVHDNGASRLPQIQAQEEYDPANATMTGFDTSSYEMGSVPQNQSSDAMRGSAFARSAGRGRGRGRGDIHSGNTGRNGRSELSSDKPNFNKAKTSVVVEQIPEESFTEEAVRDYFTQFGTIEEITMKPYKRLAIIRFDSWDSANSAYRSPKVIFDNRFVKVYWYTHDSRLPVDKHKPVAQEEQPEKPPLDLEEFARKQEEAQKAHEEKQKKVAEMEAQQRELEERQRDLLKSQAEEKSRLLARIAAKSAANGDTNGKEVSAKQSQSDALRAQLAKLEAEALSLGLDPNAAQEESWAPRGRGRGRGGYRGRGTFPPRGRGDRGGYRGGRGGAPFAGNFKLDNRPRKIKIVGQDFTDSSNDEHLRSYLLGIGEPTSRTTSSTQTELEFADRFTAEKFMYGLQDSTIPSVGKVELSWLATPLPPVDVSKLKNGGVKQEEDVDMGDAYSSANGSSGGYVGFADNGVESKGNLDYDVEDEEDQVW